LPSTLEYSEEKGIASAWRNYLKGFEGFSCKSVQHVTLPSDIELLSLDMISHANTKYIFPIEQCPIVFGFHIAGLGCSKITHSATRQETVSAEANKVIISYAPCSSCETMLLEQQHYHVFNIYVSPCRLYSQLGGKPDIAPVEIQKILDKTFHGLYVIAFNMSPQTRMIIDQIGNCPYQGDLKGLYLEHKSMELILRQFYEIQCTGGYDNSSILDPNDIDHIHEAKRILFDNIENPPALIDLAQRVGINPTKLKKGFRQVFGTTAYAMVRQERIRRACDLLGRGNLNVTEIGHQLGFSDSSHFIRVFTKYYGVTPGKYSKASAS
jgi:AraC-like DNA-binding protein